MELLCSYLLEHSLPLLLEDSDRTDSQTAVNVCIINVW